MRRFQRPSWFLPSHALTDEAAWQRFQRARLERRRLLRLGALGAAATMVPGLGCINNPTRRRVHAPSGGLPLSEPEVDLEQPGFPAPKNASFSVRRPLTERNVAAAYNNFYEFTSEKHRVWQLVGDFEPRPWTIEIRGLVEKPLTLDLDDLRKLGYEERTYRFRCVEAWAMAVPWTGVPLRKVLERIRPLSSAKYVRMVTFHRPSQALGQRSERWWPWPYYEALRIDEAANPLALLATGIYGQALPRQHGAPVRLVVPWKYGFKSIKSIATIELTDRLPRTFWNDMAPKEYAFEANVNPKVPHPRWSQAEERMIGSGDIYRSRWLNGYVDDVGHLYGPQPVAS